ncbi:MAG TPA: N-acetylmuramoyl-L-alanine amidase [Vicinamibacterales bacterium]|nr:N-acetylmuramoyl-L-alanine amidase [Vicinamibacterales bacterium]
MARATAALVALFLIAFPPLPRAQDNAPPYTLLSREGRRPIPTMTRGGRELIALDDVAALFQVTVRGDSLARAVTLTYRGKTIIASADQPMTSVDGRVVALPGPVVQAGQRWLVPIEFLSRALGPIYDQRITIRPSARLVIVGDLRVPHVSARIDMAGPPTHATFLVTPASRVTATTEGNRVLLRVEGDAIEPTFPPSAAGLIESIHLGDQPDTVVVSLTRAAAPARVATSQADNATRVTVDIPAAPDARPPSSQAQAPGVPGQDTPASVPALGQAMQTIIIDPGHGGDDIGVKGAGGLQEKQLTLDVARRVRSLIESRLGLRVIMTREDDKLVTLNERAAMANNSKAGLLVSLHANGAPSATPSGAEIFYDRLDREGEAARRAAAAQSVSLPVIGGGTRPIEIIPWDLAQAPHVGSSEVLATVLEEELRKVVPMSTRARQQAPMRLLSAANMPAALVEMAYLTNGPQEMQAGTEGFKNGVAQAIVNAITRFRSLTDDRETR